MRRNLEPKILKRIAHIRELQYAAAKAEMARANRVLSEKTEMLKLRRAEEQTVEKCWQDAVSGPSLRLELLPSWTGAVSHQSMLTRHAVGSVESAASARDRSASALHTAELHSDVASEQARIVRNEHLRKREESAVQDASDRHLQYGTRP